MGSRQVDFYHKQSIYNCISWSINNTHRLIKFYHHHRRHHHCYHHHYNTYYSFFFYFLSFFFFVKACYQLWFLFFSGHGKGCAPTPAPPTKRRTFQSHITIHSLMSECLSKPRAVGFCWSKRNRVLFSAGTHLNDTIRTREICLPSRGFRRFSFTDSYPVAIYVFFGWEEWEKIGVEASGDSWEGTKGK